MNCFRYGIGNAEITDEVFGYKNAIKLKQVDQITA